MNMLLYEKKMASSGALTQRSLNLNMPTEDVLLETDKGFILGNLYWTLTRMLEWTQNNCSSPENSSVMILRL